MNFHTQKPAHIATLVSRYASLLAVVTAAVISLVGAYYFTHTYFSAIAPDKTAESSLITYRPQTLKLKQYEEVILKQAEKQENARKIGADGLPNPFAATTQ